MTTRMQNVLTRWGWILSTLIWLYFTYTYFFVGWPKDLVLEITYPTPAIPYWVGVLICTIIPLTICHGSKFIGPRMAARDFYRYDPYISKAKLRQFYIRGIFGFIVGTIIGVAIGFTVGLIVDAIAGSVVGIITLFIVAIMVGIITFLIISSAIERLAKKIAPLHLTQRQPWKFLSGL